MFQNTLILERRNLTRESAFKERISRNGAERLCRRFFVLVEMRELFKKNRR